MISSRTVRLLPSLTLVLAVASVAHGQTITRDLPYVSPTSERQLLDVYAPAKAKGLPGVFWIHGGGWQTGHKGLVASKPKAFTEAGLVFVSVNHRFVSDTGMGDIIGDVAKGLRWVHDHVAEYGGDPTRVFVMGHSSGGQLAAIVCTDDRYLKAEGLSLKMIKGCVPVDADTFDVPAIIEVAEVRARAHGFPLPTRGHRQKFGNDPVKHRDLSAVFHVAANKGIPPFLILHVAEHPDTAAQARRFAAVLAAAGVPTEVLPVRDTWHEAINNNIGKDGDPGSEAVFAFVRRLVAR